MDIATLIGLLGGLGIAIMAVVLLTTLYGAMLATVIALPIADKLNNRASEEALNRALVIDGLVAIQAGQNPRVIEQMLRNYLPEKKRASAE